MASEAAIKASISKVEAEILKLEKKEEFYHEQLAKAATAEEQKPFLDLLTGVTSQLGEKHKLLNDLRRRQLAAPSEYVCPGCALKCGSYDELRDHVELVKHRSLPEELTGILNSWPYYEPPILRRLGPLSAYPLVWLDLIARNYLPSEALGGRDKVMDELRRRTQDLNQPDEQKTDTQILSFLESLKVEPWQYDALSKCCIAPAARESVELRMIEMRMRTDSVHDISVAESKKRGRGSNADRADGADAGPVAESKKRGRGSNADGADGSPGDAPKKRKTGDAGWHWWFADLYSWLSKRL